MEERERECARRLHSRGIDLGRGSSTRGIGLGSVVVAFDFHFADSPSRRLEAGYKDLPFSSRPVELHPKRNGRLRAKSRHKLGEIRNRQLTRLHA